MAGILAGRLTRSVAAESSDDAKTTGGTPDTRSASASGHAGRDTAPSYTRAPAPVVGMAGAEGSVGMVGLTDMSDRSGAADRTDLMGDDPDLAVQQR